MALSDSTPDSTAADTDHRSAARLLSGVTATATPVRADSDPEPTSGEQLATPAKDDAGAPNDEAAKASPEDDRKSGPVETKPSDAAKLDPPKVEDPKPSEAKADAPKVEDPKPSEAKAEPAKPAAKAEPPREDAAPASKDATSVKDATPSSTMVVTGEPAIPSVQDIEQLLMQNDWAAAARCLPMKSAKAFPPNLAVVAAIAHHECGTSDTAATREVAIAGIASALGMSADSEVVHILARRLLRSNPAHFYKQPAPPARVSAILIGIAVVVGGGLGWVLSSGWMTRLVSVVHH